MQVSEKIEGRVTKKLTQEISWTQSSTLGALSELDNFLAGTDTLRKHTVKIPEQWLGKLETNWGSFAE